MRYPVMVEVGATQWTAKELVLMSAKSKPVGESRAEEKGDIGYIILFIFQSMSINMHLVKNGLILTV